MEQGVDATIGKRQENVKRASRLLGHSRPEPELKDLPRRAGLVACERLDVDVIHDLQVWFLP
jgi:hypothetical protein